MARNTTKSPEQHYTSSGNTSKGAKAAAPCLEEPMQSWGSNNNKKPSTKPLRDTSKGAEKSHNCRAYPMQKHTGELCHTNRTPGPMEQISKTQNIA